jgi:hypothetical protein
MLKNNQMALKEWACIIHALGQGTQIILLRKGGLVEGAGQFHLAAKEFFLYPTYEHQQGELLQPQYTGIFREIEAGNPSKDLVFQYYAVVADVWPAPNLDRMKQLHASFVWSDLFLEQRYRYKPQLPMWLLVVRTYRLPRPIRLPVHPAYAGCRSWVELEEKLSPDGAVPVLLEEEFMRRRHALRQQVL